MKLLTTLALIEEDGQVLLAMKKRGFGAGWWNGYGGKVEKGETIEQAMLRELEEESGLTAKTYEKRAVLDFVFEDTGDCIEMHAFAVTAYRGELIESEEMTPRWFPQDKLPYDEMWPGDDQWMPRFFAGQHFRTKITFAQKPG